MTYTAERAVHEIGSELSAALVSDVAQLGLRELVQKFPALGGTQYLECRLVDSVPQVDFLVSVTKYQRRKLAKSLERESAPGLQGLQRFLSQWLDADSLVHERVPVIWLEFDDVLAQRTPSANVCMCVCPGYVDPFAEVTSLPAAELHALIAASASAVLGADACPAHALAACADYIEKLPANAHFIHLSVMQERQPIELKLYGSFPEESLLPYLESIRWKGDLTALERLIDRYCPTRRTGGTLHVDLPLPSHADAAPSLGISFAQQQLRRALENQPNRRYLLRALLEDGLASPAKVEALERWPGEQARPAARRGVTDRVQTWCDVKLVYRQAQPLLAKAYLGFVAEPEFVRPALDEPTRGGRAHELEAAGAG